MEYNVVDVGWWVARDEYVFGPQKWAMIFKLTLGVIILLFPFLFFYFFLNIRELYTLQLLVMMQIAMLWFYSVFYISDYFKSH